MRFQWHPLLVARLVPTVMVRTLGLEPGSRLRSGAADDHLAATDVGGHPGGPRVPGVERLMNQRSPFAMQRDGPRIAVHNGARCHVATPGKIETCRARWLRAGFARTSTTGSTSFPSWFL